MEYREKSNFSMKKPDKHYPSKVNIKSNTTWTLYTLDIM